MNKQEILNCDCLEYMKKVSDKYFDLVITDPPYGISADGGVGGFGSSKTDKHYSDDWDKQTPPKEYFDEIIRIGKKVIVFGGNFFTDKLPVNGHWIVWDKKGNIDFENPFGDCEIAWTNINKKSVKKYTVIQQGFISEERDRFHPTQKPVKLFGQIIKDYLEEKDNIIFDPFMGSGTTIVAANYLGIRAVGIDINKKYCDIAQNRIKQNILF